eukprot:g4627.t1
MEDNTRKSGDPRECSKGGGGSGGVRGSEEEERFGCKSATSGGTSSLPTLLASSTAGVLARFPCHPLDTCKARLQVQGDVSSGGGIRYRNFIDVVRRTYKVEGFRGLYRGFGVTAIGSAPAMAVYLTSYEKCKDALPEFHPIFERTPSFAHFVAGMLAETISCLLWVPIDVTKERLQVQELGGAHNYRGNIDAVRTIWRTEGLTGAYKGYLATILSFGPQSAFMFTFYEQMKRFSRSVLDVHADAEMPFAAHLFNSVVAGCGAALVTNPLDMVKLRLQVQRVSPGAFETPWGGEAIQWDDRRARPDC